MVHQQQQTKTLPNSTREDIIARQIEGIQKMIRLHDGPEEQKRGIIQINPAMIRHWELEIETLQDAPRDADKLRKLVKAKQIELEDAIKIEDTERLYPEIEMLRFVLCAVSRNESKETKYIISIMVWSKREVLRNKEYLKKTSILLVEDV